MINEQQETMVKEMFTKWSNMKNAKLIVKEADSVSETLASSMKTEEEWIARYQITINGKTQRLTVTSNTKETEILKREILDD